MACRSALRRGRRIAAAVGAAGTLILLAPLAPAYAVGALFHHGVEVKAPSDTGVVPATSLYTTACTGNGKCVAGGDYMDRHVPSRTQAFVAVQSRGKWVRSVKITPPKGAATDPGAVVLGVACVSTGNCVAVGGYTYGAKQDEKAFIATEKGGKWARASAPRLPANVGSFAWASLNAVTCLSSGYCEAVGQYDDTAGHVQSMAIVKPAGGRWRRAKEIKAPAGAATDPRSVLGAVACLSAGHCFAVGSYSVGASYQAMAAVQTSGKWHHAVHIAPPANGGSNSAFLNGIACRSGVCTAVGEYYFAPTIYIAMSVRESKNHFGTGQEITVAPPDADPSPHTNLYSISCPKSGNCVAVGTYQNSSGYQASLSMAKTSHGWKPATLTLPSKGLLGPTRRSVGYSVSCVGAEHCTAVGYYPDSAGNFHADAWSTG